MNEDARAVAGSLDDTVRAVPGVVSVFAADPTLVRSAKQLTSGDEALPLVVVRSEHDVLSVTVSVGVHESEQAPLPAAAVGAAVRAALPGRKVEVAVRVSRVAYRVVLGRHTGGRATVG